MPNWVTNELIVEGDKSQIVAMMEKVKKEKRFFSLDQVIPTPVELCDVAAPVRIVSPEEYEEEVCGTKKRGSGRPLTAAMSRQLIAEYGFNNWYDWQTEN